MNQKYHLSSSHFYFFTFDYQPFFSLHTQEKEHINYQQKKCYVDFSHSSYQTTLCQENNHTYTSGLRDFGELEFGSNLTQSTMDMFLNETDGFYATYEAQRKAGKYLWVCIDIKHINKSYFVPVEPQDFGLPGGEAGSNKYDLSVFFSVIGDAYWAADLEEGYTTPYGETEAE